MEARIKIILIFFLRNVFLCQGYAFGEDGTGKNQITLGNTESQESNVEADLLQEALKKIELFKESFDCPSAFTIKECYEIALNIVSNIIEDTIERTGNQPLQDETVGFRKPKIPLSISLLDPQKTNVESEVVQEVQDKLATLKESFYCPPAFTYKECFEVALNITSNIIDDAIDRSVNQPPLEDTVKLENHKEPTFPWWPSFEYDPNDNQDNLNEAVVDLDTDKEFIIQMGISEDEEKRVVRSDDYDKPFYCRCRDGAQGHGHFNCRCRPIIDQPLKFTSISG